MFVLRWFLSRAYLHVITLGIDDPDVDPKVKRIAAWGTAAFLIGAAVLCVILAVFNSSLISRIVFVMLALLSISLAVRGIRYYLKNK